MTKFFFFLLLSSPFSLFGSLVENGLKKISLNDRANMKVFFENGIKSCQLSHVLFFDTKPACSIAFMIKGKYRTFYDIQYLKGWFAFKKHEHFFPHPGVIFNANIVDFEKDGAALHIYVINEKATLCCLNSNIKLFRENLDPNFDPTTFIKQLQSGTPLLKLLNNNDFLIGVLLGFGEESSKAFYQRNQTSVVDEDFDSSTTYCGISADGPTGCKIFPIAFMGNPESVEVKQLCSTYKSELDDFWKNYNETKQKLKMTLHQLCSKSP